MLNPVRSNPLTSAKVPLMIAMPIKSGWKNSITGKGVSKSMGNPISNPTEIAPSTTNGNPICRSKDFVPNE
jgi:hypothetical protein